MKKGAIILLGAAAVGYFLLRKAKDITPKYDTPTEGWTTFEIHWRQGYDKDWYGDGISAREEALEGIGQEYRSLGIINGVEHLEWEAANDLHAEGVRGVLIMHEAVGDVINLGAFA